MNQLVIFTLKPEKATAFKEGAIKSLHASLNEDGNLEMKLFKDVEDSNTLYVYSRWKNEEAYSFHQEQSHTKLLRKLAKESLRSAPRILELGETKPFPDYTSQHKNEMESKEILFFIFKFKEEYKERLLTQFENHITNTRQEKANFLFDLYTIDGVNDEFVVYEEWENKSAIFDIHFKQPYSLVTGKLMEEAVIGNLEQYMHFVKEIK